MPQLWTHACRQSNAFAAHCRDKHTAKLLQAACPLPTTRTSLTRHQTAYHHPAGNPATLTLTTRHNPAHVAVAPSHVTEPLTPPCTLKAHAAALITLNLEAKPECSATASQLQATLKGALSTATTRTQQATQHRRGSSSMHAVSNCHCCKLAAHAQSCKTYRDPHFP
jgi:hypothetical protein